MAKSAFNVPMVEGGVLPLVPKYLNDSELTYGGSKIPPGNTRGIYFVKGDQSEIDAIASNPDVAEIPSDGEARERISNIPWINLSEHSFTFGSE